MFNSEIFYKIEKRTIYFYLKFQRIFRIIVLFSPWFAVWVWVADCEFDSLPDPISPGAALEEITNAHKAAIATNVFIFLRNVIL